MLRSPFFSSLLFVSLALAFVLPQSSYCIFQASNFDLLQLNETQFREQVENVHDENHFALVMFYAPWNIQPLGFQHFDAVNRTLQNIEQKHWKNKYKILCATIDTSTHTALNIQYQTFTFPTYVLFRSGKMIDKFTDTEKLDFVNLSKHQFWNYDRVLEFGMKHLGDELNEKISLDMIEQSNLLVLPDQVPPRMPLPHTILKNPQGELFPILAAVVFGALCFHIARTLIKASSL